MFLSEFTNVFLPRLASLYESSSIQLHGLVDIDLWKKVFPQEDLATSDFTWYQIRFQAISIKDHILLIIFILPDPQKAGGRKFVAMFIDRKKKKIQLLCLERPRFYDDSWKIIKIANRPEEELEKPFEKELLGAPILSNFVRGAIEIYSQDKSFNFFIALRNVYKSLFDTIDD